MLNFNQVVFTVVAYLFYINTKCCGDFIDDYCWRDYDGIAPKDALKAGIDRNGDPIYIGQTLYENKLIPGKVHANASEIHIEFHTVHTITETIKMLCTKCPDKFEWFKTRYDEVLQIKDKQIFEGGYEKGYITYIGRALSHGEMTVGKVICFHDGCYKLTTIEAGKWYDHGEFEILTYNPNVTTCDPPTATANPSRGDAPHKPSFLSYFLLVLVIAALIVLVVVLVRRC